MLYTSLLEKALRFAAVAHKTQTRKSSDVPYFYHPFAVFSMLQHYNYPIDWCIAALLHDTLEDTATTESEIEDTFGAAILQLVRQASEPEHDNAPWIERKTHTISFLKDAALPAKIIACADKLHNLHSILFDIDVLGETVWRRFNQGKKMQRWYHESVYTSLCENIADEGEHPILAEYRELIKQVFAENHG